jgi:adhesin transport system outer membrane protein
LSVTRGAGYSYLWEGSVTARQMVFDAFETKNRIDAARSSEKAAVMELVNTRDDLTLRAVQTYVNLLRARTGHKMVTAYKASVDSYLKRIKALVDEGAADEAELQQARDVSIILKNFEADYMGQIKAAESDYVELTGEMPSGELSLPQAPVDLIPTDMDAALEMVKAEHALIRGAKLLAKSAKYGIEAEKAGYYPDVDGELSFMKSDKDDVIGGEVEDGKAVLRMNWAFETGGAQSARVNKKRLEHKTALARLKIAEREIERMVRLAYAEQETASAQYQNQKMRQDLNQKLFDTYETQFEGAVVSLLQLMQSDNQLFNAKLEAMNAKYRYALSQYGALASIGKLQTALGGPKTNIASR